MRMPTATHLRSISNHVFGDSRTSASLRKHMAYCLLFMTTSFLLCSLIERSMSSLVLNMALHASGNTQYESTSSGISIIPLPTEPQAQPQAQAQAQPQVEVPAIADDAVFKWKPIKQRYTSTVTRTVDGSVSYLPSPISILGFLSPHEERWRSLPILLSSLPEHKKESEYENTNTNKYNNEIIDNHEKIEEDRLGGDRHQHDNDYAEDLHAGDDYAKSLDLEDFENMGNFAFIQPDTIFPSLTSESTPHTTVFSWDFISSGKLFESYHVHTLPDVFPYGLFVYDCPNEGINSDKWVLIEQFVKYADQNVFCALRSESTSTTEEPGVATDSAATSDSATTTTTTDISNPAETEMHRLQYEEKDHKSSMDVLFEKLESSETHSFKDEKYKSLWLYLDSAHLDADMEAVDSESVPAAASSVPESKTVESASTVTVTTASASATTSAAPVNDNSSTVNASLSANSSAGDKAEDGHKQTVLHLILGKNPDKSFLRTYFFCFVMLVFHIVWWVILTVVTTMISNFIIMWIFRDVILVEVTWSGIHIISQGDDEPFVDPKKLLTKEQVLSLPEVEFDKDGELNIVPMNTNLDIAFGGFDSDNSHDSLTTCGPRLNSPPSSPTRKARIGFKIGGGGGSATVMARNGPGEGDEESQLLLQDRHRMDKLKQRAISFRNHTCSICLDDFEDSELVRVLPCGHMYHTDCVMPWLTTRIANCPLCKAPLFEDEKDKKHC